MLYASAECNTITQAMDLTEDDAKKMKVADLRAALEARGASTSGLKAALLQRLLDIVRSENVDSESVEKKSGMFNRTLVVF